MLRFQITVRHLGHACNLVGGLRASSAAQRGRMLGQGESASPGVRPGQAVLEAGCAAGDGPESSAGTGRVSDDVFWAVC